MSASFETTMYFTFVITWIIMLIIYNRLVKAEKAIAWFATHIRIDRTDLENDPIPEDLAEYVQDIVDTDD